MNKKAKPDNLENDIKKVLDSLLEIDPKQLELYQSLFKEIDFNKIDNAEYFGILINYPFSQFVEAMVKDKISKNEDVIFIYSNYSFLEHNINGLFEKYEGSACSYDKTRTIVNSLVWFFETGKRIDFNYDGDITYHLPKKVLKQHDDIVEFYQGLKELYYGKNTIYLHALNKIMGLSRV